MLIFRYLAKEVFITLVSLTTILMLIFMSNQFVRYLSRAASGQFPLSIIMQLMLLEVPNLLGLLLPLGFYVSLLIAYGRMYADSEMTVLEACGYGPNQLLKASYQMAIIVSFIVLIIMLWASPIIAIQRMKLLHTSGIETLMQTIMPGHFTSISNGRKIIYLESLNRGQPQEAHRLFLGSLVMKDNKPQWNILRAKTVRSSHDVKTSENYLILEDGHEYEGVPGRRDYQITDFEKYKTRLPQPSLVNKDDIRTLKTDLLLPFLNKDRRKAAELQWRLSIPLMVLTLTMVAVPLSRVNPRSGKFARLLPAIAIFIVYVNFMFATRNWIVEDKIPVWLGMWWIHILVLIIGLLLIIRNRFSAT